MSTATFALRDRAARSDETAAAAATVVSRIRLIAKCVGGLIAGYMMRRAQLPAGPSGPTSSERPSDRLLKDIGISRSEIGYAVKFGGQDAN